MDRQDFTIGVLSVTAVVLLVGLMLIGFIGPGNAYAIGQNSVGGDYLVCTAQLDDNTEILYVLDAAVGRLNVYGFDLNVGRIELIAAQNVQMRAQQNEQPRGRAR